MKPKIYKISNTINDKLYVGQTWKNTIEERFDRHCAEARWKNTKDMPIVLAIKKYGKENFKIELLEELPDDCDQSLVDQKEIEWGTKLNALSPSGYNLKLGSGRGVLSEETKEKISNSNKGKVATKETIEKLRISHLGYKVKQETKEKLSKYFSGKPSHENSKRLARIKNSKRYVLTTQDHRNIEFADMTKFCKENGHSISSMYKLRKNIIKRYKNFISIKDLGYLRDELGSRRNPKPSINPNE